MMRRAAFVLMLAATCLLQGCVPGRVYQKPLAEARTILAKTGLPPFVFGSEDPEFSVDLHDPARVTWVVKQNKIEILRFDAELSAASETTTRVNVVMTAPSEGPLGDIAARLEANPSIRDLYRKAMEERVASALEERDFNMASLYPDMMQASLANMTRLQASADAAAAASDQSDRDNIARAYAEEAAGKRN